MLNGGYVVGEGSVYEAGVYKCVNNTSIKKIPKKLKDYLIEVMKEKTANEEKKKNKKNKIKIDVIDEDDKQLQQDYLVYLSNNIKIDDDYLYNVLDKLPKDYINYYEGWRKFTSALKCLKKKDVWDTISKKGQAYDIEKNNDLWDSIDANVYHLLHILNVCGSSLGNSIKYTPIIKSNMTADSTINRKKLGGKNFDIISYNNSYIIKSDTGTGKTTQFIIYFSRVQQKKKHFISIVDRVSLADSHYKDFTDPNKYKDKIRNFTNEKVFIDNVNHYKNDKIVKDENCIICINSLHRYDILSFDLSNTILFLDEISSTLKTIILSPIIKDRIRILNIFRKLIKNCFQVVAVDADIDKSVIDFVKALRDDVIIVENTHKHNKGIKAIELTDEDVMINKLKNDDKYILCCDSATKAESIYKRLDDDNIKLITDDKVGDDKDYINLEHWDKVIYSPKILRGVDDNKFDRNVYVYYKEHTISPEDMLQQFTRCRRIKKLFFLFTKKNFQYVPSLKEHNNIQDEIKKLSEELDYINQEFLNEYLSIRKTLLYNLEAYGSNKYIHFCMLLKERGFKVYQKFIRPKTKGITKKEREEVKEERLENFDMERQKYKKLNQYLRIPEDIIYKDDIIKELFINPVKTTNHFNVCYVLNYTNEELLERIQKKEDYAISKYHSSINKVRFLKKMYDTLNISIDNVMIDINNINDDGLNKIEKEYKIMFRDRSKKTFKDNIQRIIIKITKDLLGRDIINSKKAKINGVSAYNYKVNKEVNKEVLEFHKRIYKFRKQQKIQNKRLF
jgi:hypothetical protein